MNFEKLNGVKEAINEEGNVKQKVTILVLERGQMFVTLNKETDKYRAAYTSDRNLVELKSLSEEELTKFIEKAVSGKLENWNGTVQEHINNAVRNGEFTLTNGNGQFTLLERNGKIEAQFCLHANLRKSTAFVLADTEEEKQEELIRKFEEMDD